MPVEVLAAKHADGRIEEFDPALVVHSMVGLGLWDTEWVRARLTKHSTYDGSPDGENGDR